MHKRPLIGRLYGPVAVVLMTAAGMQLAGGIPAQAQSQAAAVFQPLTSQDGPVLGDYAVTATMVLKVRRGALVSISGGPGNCTADETNSTAWAGHGPLVQEFGFRAQNTGSCIFGRSYAEFTVTVARHGHVVASAAVALSQNSDGYSASCLGGRNLSCRQVSRLTLVLTQGREACGHHGGHHGGHHRGHHRGHHHGHHGGHHG
jgi:hypothetical protein